MAVAVQVGGSIPACAGEAPPSSSPSRRTRVHPRVCGGSETPLHRVVCRRGPSPRVRGKQPHRPLRRKGPGSIPACAGEAPTRWTGTTRPAVHPRVCGGSVWILGILTYALGPSPRVRGKRCPAPPSKWARRSIPACAGEASSADRKGTGGTVHPRVCGGSTRSVPSTIRTLGPSPRVRGKPVHHPEDAPSDRSIPACAGEARRLGRPSPYRRVHPRVCGGSSGMGLLEFEAGGPSPRVRGKHAVARPCPPGVGSIPACAGEAR